MEVYVYKTGFQFVAETSRDFNVSRINPVTAVGDDWAKDIFTSKSSMVKVFDAGARTQPTAKVLGTSQLKMQPERRINRNCKTELKLQIYAPL